MDPFSAFVLGAILGGMVGVFIGLKLGKSDPERQQINPFYACPHCAEAVRTGATYCPHCHRTTVASSKAAAS